MPDIKQRTTTELMLIRQNNLKNWDEEDWAFYEEFFEEPQKDTNSEENNVPNLFVEESWKSFNELNHTILSTSDKKVVL